MKWSKIGFARKFIPAKLKYITVDYSLNVSPTGLPVDLIF